MFLVQAEDLPSRMSRGGCKNGIVYIKSMARMPLPMENRRLIDDFLVYGGRFELRQKQERGFLLFGFHEKDHFRPLHGSRPQFIGLNVAKPPQEIQGFGVSCRGARQPSP